MELNYLQIFAIIKAIPLAWKKQLKQDRPVIKCVCSLDKINLKTPHFAKYVYWKIIESNNFTDPGKIKWEIELGMKITDNEWRKVREMAFLISPVSKLKYFQYGF